MCGQERLEKCRKLRKGLPDVPKHPLLSPAMVDQLIFKYIGTQYEEAVWDWLAEELKVDAIRYPDAHLNIILNIRGYWESVAFKGDEEGSTSVEQSPSDAS